MMLCIMYSYLIIILLSVNQKPLPEYSSSGFYHNEKLKVIIDKIQLMGYNKYVLL